MKTNQKLSLVLQTIKEAGLPVGASYISSRLNMAPATVGRILAELDKNGLLTKVSNKGRILTQKGYEHLAREAQKKEKKETAAQLVHTATKADKTTLLEILQVRRLLEVYTARQACQNATEDEICELERLMLEHLHEIRRGGLGSSIDLEIHLAIARFSRVQTIYQILKIILTEDNVYTKFSYVSDHVKHTQIKQHDAIIQAIRERNPEKAGEAMNIHLTQVMADVEQYYQENT